MWQQKQWNAARMEMLSAPYYSFAFQMKWTSKPFSTVERRGRARLCLGCSLPLWVFICIYQSLSSSLLHHAISPPSSDYDLWPAASERHLHAPSQLCETNELPATTVSIFRHNTIASTSSLKVCFTSCKTPACMPTLLQRKGAEQTAPLGGRRQWAAMTTLEADKWFAYQCLT